MTRSASARGKRVRHPTAAPDATIEPDPGPAPEAVFDRVTGPFVRRAVAPLPGAVEDL